MSFAEKLSTRGAVSNLSKKATERHVLFATITGFILTVSVSVRADYTAVVNPASVVATNFEGWGSSLCWWANVVGGYANRDIYMNLAFTQLKLNIVRYNIGGGENPNGDFITNYRAIMQGFEPNPGVWNWNADQNQRWVLRQALALGANRVVAFANSPPWWMTYSGSVTGAGPSGGATNNLQVAYEDTFAVYLATVVSNLTVLDGVHFNYVTPVNEPAANWWYYGDPKQEGCHMDASQQARVVNDLRAELNARGWTNVGIDAPEDYSESSGISDLNAYGSAVNNVALLTTHTYSANNPSGFHSLAVSLGRPVWVSEYGDGYTDGMVMARRIHDDIAGLGARAWIYWQFVDNAGGWGFLYNPLTTNSTGGFNTSYTINEKFYVMGQFSEFIRPGCNIISVNDANTLAAWDPTNSTLVLVMVNTNASSLNVTYDLSAFASVPSQAAVYQTDNAGENLATLPSLSIINRLLTSFIPAQSVTTFVLTWAPVITNQLPLPYTNLFTLYAGANPTFQVSASGASLSYQWFTNGMALGGATNASLTLPSVPVGFLTNYCLVTNPGGSATSIVWRASVIAATNFYSLTVLSNNPIAYWRLNETAGSAIANDYAGGASALYGANTTNGLPGVPLAGFANERGVAMDNQVATPGAGYVTNAGVILNTNTVTFLCWVLPFTNQFNPSGLIFCRSGSAVAGSQIGGGEALDYTWSNNPATYNYGSGLVVPTNIWSLVALTTTPSNAVLFVFNASGQGSATNAVANPPQSLFNGLALGADPQPSTLPKRIFNGEMDEAAIFNYPLSTAQLRQLYFATTNLVPSINLAPTNIVFSVMNNQLTLAWPADHTGWRLQAQTNSLAAGLGTNWADVTGSTTTNRVIIPINPTNGIVFYRVVSP